jgi:hypothetical protein
VGCLFQKLNAGIWTLEIDIERTTEFYLQYQDKCECSYCLNYEKACHYIDEDVKNFFHSLGINLKKPWHLSDFATDNEDVLEYIASYYLVGRMLKGEFASTSNWQKSNTYQLQNFTFAFIEDIEFVPDGLSQPILQLDAVAYMPWKQEENGRAMKK